MKSYKYKIGVDYTGGRISCLNYNFNRCAIGETGTTLKIRL